MPSGAFPGIVEFYYTGPVAAINRSFIFSPLFFHRGLIFVYINLFSFDLKV